MCSPRVIQVELAFQEAKADVTRCEINLKNKPEWFASRVNPAAKVRSCAFLLATVPIDYLSARRVTGPSFSVREP
jgi:glutathione S-transferase